MKGIFRIFIQGTVEKDRWLFLTFYEGQRHRYRYDCVALRLLENRKMKRKKKSAYILRGAYATSLSLYRPPAWQRAESWRAESISTLSTLSNFSTLSTSQTSKHFCIHACLGSTMYFYQKWYYLFWVNSAVLDKVD